MMKIFHYPGLKTYFAHAIKPTGRFFPFRSHSSCNQIKNRVVRRGRSGRLEVVGRKVRRCSNVR